MTMLKRIWVAASAAAVAAMFGAWLGWHDAGDLPTDAEMRAIVELVTSGGAPEEIERADHIAGLEYHAFQDADSDFLFGHDEYGPGYVRTDLSRPIGDLAPVAARLAAAGWRVGDAGGTELTAARGDWRLAVGAADRSWDASVEVERVEPVAGLVLSLVFGSAGGVLGWVLCRFAGDRLGATGVLGFGLMSLNTVAVIVSVGQNLKAYPGTDLFAQPWEFFATIIWRPLTLIGMVLAAVWAIRARAAQRATRPERTRVARKTGGAGRNGTPR